MFISQEWGNRPLFLLSRFHTIFLNHIHYKVISKFGKLVQVSVHWDWTETTRLRCNILNQTTMAASTIRLFYFNLLNCILFYFVFYLLFTISRNVRQNISFCYKAFSYFSVACYELIFNGFLLCLHAMKLTIEVVFTFADF